MKHKLGYAISCIQERQKSYCIVLKPKMGTVCDDPAMQKKPDSQVVVH